MRRYGLKIAALLLSAVFVFAIFPSLKSNADMNYAFDSVTGTLTISGDGEITKSEVAEIGRDAVKIVIIEDGVTSIGDSAFLRCSNLTSITIPDSVTSIGDSAFLRCSNLTSITIPDSVTSIGIKAFALCSKLTSVTIPNSVTSIGEGTFQECTRLTSVTIPNSVTSIGEYAFFYCISLTSVTIPNSVTSIGEYAFYFCISLTSVTIPNSVTSIGESAFQECTSLTSVAIPNSVTSIGECAFMDCDTLISTDESISIDKALYDSNKSAFPSIPDSSFNYTKYNITYGTPANGTVSGVAKSTSATDITLTVKPNTNYIVDTVTVTDSTGTKQISLDSNNIYSFTMPSEDVTVDATFKLIQKTVSFVTDDGTVLKVEDFDYGATPAYTGDTPAKNEDEQYTYTFAGWTDGTKTYGPTDALPAVTDDVKYTAVFTGTTNKYIVTFTDESGKALQSSEIEYGQVPAYTGDTPAKNEDEQYTYTFAGWTDGVKTYGPTDSLPAVKADITYTAVFNEVVKPEPVVEPDPVVEPKLVEEPKTVLPNDYYVDSIVGDGSQGSIVITVKANGDVDNSFELLDRVEAGGKTLAVGSDIDVNQGSTIITLKKSYIDTLTEGLNSITVYFKDGGSITVNFNVKKADATPAANVPSTGETMSIYTYIGVGLMLSSVSFVGYNVMKKREEET